MLKYVAVFALVAATVAQDFADYDSAPRPAPQRLKPAYSAAKSPPPPPVAIIKQINRHNDDGSYTYGYESADGSFKIETKNPTGEVKGKYGYVDDLGKVRVIEYGATKYGFAPAGEGITVPPPTIVDETTDKNGALLPEYSGAYDQGDEEPASAPVRAQATYSSSQTGSNFEFSSLPAARPAPRPASRPANVEYSPPQTFEPVQAQAPSRPAPSSYSFDFPSRPVPAQNRPAFTPAPAPPRPAFANAAPAPGPLEDFGSIPSRPAPKLTFAQPAPIRPAPQPQPSYAPPPAPRPAPQYRPAPTFPGRPGGGSILDQLSKDYALPPSDSSSPSHEISFGYF